MKPELKTVYLRTNESGYAVIHPVNYNLVDSVVEQELVVFTKEEYNQFVCDIIRDYILEDCINITLKKFLID